MPPGLTSKRPLLHTFICRLFDYGAAGSGFPTVDVQVALGSPFGLLFHAAFPPTAALSHDRFQTYLLFVIGLDEFIFTYVNWDVNRNVKRLQKKFRKNLHK